jgi:hypothetical protein
MVAGEVPHLDERRPRHGSGIGGWKQPEGIAPDPHGQERVHKCGTPRGRRPRFG